MLRTFNARLRGAGVLLTLLLTGELHAQPTLPIPVWEQVWEKPLISTGVTVPSTAYQNILRLPTGRYGLTGYRIVNDSTTPSGLTDFILLTLVNPNSGDSVRSIRYPNLRRGDYYGGVSLNHDGTLLNTGFWSSNTWTIYPDFCTLQKFDTLGAFQFQHQFSVPPGNLTSREPDRTFPTQTELPDGYLMAYNLDRNGPNRYVDAGLLRLDRRGRVRRVHSSNANYSDYLTALRPLSDGSYLASGQKIGAGANTDEYFGQDHLLWRIRASGEVLDSVVFGVDGWHERARAIRQTPDGGYIMAGTVNQLNVPTAQRGEQGEITKLDSAFRVQWKRRIYGADNSPLLLPPCNIFDVYPMESGGYIAIGRMYVPYLQFSPVPVGRAVLLHLDAAGQIVWQQTYRPPLSPLIIETEAAARFTDWVYEPDGSVTLLGTYNWEQPIATYHTATWLLKLTGLPAPWTPDLCARPPAAPTLLAPALEVAPRTFRYRADSTTAAGPRYADLSLCTWEWGDGTALDTGWVAEHRFQTGQPVRVRQCVVNNLFCQTCTEHFPLGPVGVGAPAAVAEFSVFPNPSADGRFTVSGVAPGGVLEVRDVTGRVVWRGQAADTGDETLLNLRAHPAGVYVLRATEPTGRTLSHKLVR